MVVAALFKYGSTIRRPMSWMYSAMLDWRIARTKLSGDEVGEEAALPAARTRDCCTNGRPPRKVALPRVSTRVAAVPVTPAELWTAPRLDLGVPGCNAANAGMAAAISSATATITPAMAA